MMAIWSLFQIFHVIVFVYLLRFYQLFISGTLLSVHIKPHPRLLLASLSAFLIWRAGNHHWHGQWKKWIGHWIGLCWSLFPHYYCSIIKRPLWTRWSSILTREVTELSPEILSETYKGIGRGSQSYVSFLINAAGWSKNDQKMVSPQGGLIRRTWHLECLCLLWTSLKVKLKKIVVKW